MSNLTVALVGCGRIAQRHAAVLQDIPGLELAAVCDIDFDKARDLGDRYGVPAYINMHAMVDTIRPSIISVLTPSGLHATHVIALAEYHTPIIVEKPIALTLHDATWMIRTCEASDTPLFVVMQNRFNVPIGQLRHALTSGKFGKLVSASVCVRWCRHQDYYSDWHGTWRMAGGVLANQASHHIDLLQWMVGESKSTFAYATTALVNAEVEDTLVAVVKFTNGVIATVEVTTAARPVDTEGSFTLLGEHGLVKVGGFACNRISSWQFDDGEQLDIMSYSENPPDVYGFGHRAYYQHVRDCLLGKDRPLVTGQEARKSLALTIAMYQSVEMNREVGVTDEVYSTRMGSL